MRSKTKLKWPRSLRSLRTKFKSPSASSRFWNLSYGRIWAKFNYMTGSAACGCIWFACKYYRRFFRCKPINIGLRTREKINNTYYTINLRYYYSITCGHSINSDNPGKKGIRPSHIETSPASSLLWTTSSIS